MKTEDYFQKVIALLEEDRSLKVSLLTLTLRNRKWLETAIREIRKYKSDFLKKRRLKKSELYKFIGYVGNIEFTNKGRGWNSHAHLIVLHHKELDVGKIKNEWYNLTGCYHVDLRPVEPSIQNSLHSTVSYLTKPKHIIPNESNETTLQAKVIV
ncbi:MAG: hypothetical protein R3F02_06320 [Thiolinea sp.]